MKLFISLIVAACLCTSAYSQDKVILDQAMTNPYRPASDKARDSIRKAAEILQFMGVKQADTALDLIAMGGWYTEVLSYAVGPSGKVYMQNNPIPITERSTEERAERMSRLSNVDDYVGPIANLTPNSVDFVMTALNFHDVYNRSATDADQMLKEILRILKPGGILSIIDHQGSEGANNAVLHRITFRNAVKASVAAGFMLVGTSDILENPNDDHTLAPFDPSLERRTDRFVLKFAKPM
jgi:predicted methyltransferase|tara:strand:+ start:1703 stop:2419 length:717 start_codon:yes stop_codon:yes gene_type:complete